MEKTFEALTLKKVETAYTVDPLFRKTCAEFDESGASGLLAYSLRIAVDGEGIVFDSIDYSLYAQAEIDASLLDEPVSLNVDTTAQICPTFAEFCFDTNAEVPRLQAILQQAISHPVAQQMDTNPFQEATNDDHYDDDSPLYDDAYQSEGEEYSVENDHDNHSRHMNDIQLGFEDEEESRYVPAEDSTQSNLFSYFDTAKSSWAGPEHWKIRRRVGFLAKANAQHAVKEPKKRLVTVLEFYTATPNMSALFAKPVNSATVTLTQAAILERATKSHCLPDDFHFSSANLLGLFCKPNWRKTTVRVRKQVHVGACAPTEDVDASYWADQGTHESGLAAELNGLDDHNNDSPQIPSDHDDFAPLPTQESIIPTIDFGAALNTGTRPALPFARQAKHINIQRLKDALWTDLSSSSSSLKNSKKLDTSAMTFTSVISKLPNSYNNPERDTSELGDITIPYCFICLLHLANEHSLQLEGDGLTGDLLISREAPSPQK